MGNVKAVCMDYTISGYSLTVIVHENDKALRKFYEEQTKQVLSEGSLRGFCRSCVPTGGVSRPIKGLQVHLAAPVGISVLAHEVTHAVHHAYWSRSKKRIFPAPNSEIEECMATDVGELVGEIWEDLVCGGYSACVRRRRR